MGKKLFFGFIFLVLSVIVQHRFKISLSQELINGLLTTLSIFFGFYMTSFAVFATSKYLNKLYKKQDPEDNRKTLLDDLIGEFSFAVKVLLVSMVYLIFLNLCFVNKWGYSESINSLLWGILLSNFLLSLNTISIFIKVTNQSAKLEPDF